jgi:hypothetical protein
LEITKAIFRIRDEEPRKLFCFQEANFQTFFIQAPTLDHEMEKITLTKIQTVNQIPPYGQWHWLFISSPSIHLEDLFKHSTNLSPKALPVYGYHIPPPIQLFKSYDFETKTFIVSYIEHSECFTPFVNLCYDGIFYHPVYDLPELAEKFGICSFFIIKEI